MARYPVEVVRVASGFQPPNRPDHFGLDLAGAPGAAVLAPESGRVVEARASANPNRPNNTVGLGAPWEGYGPGVVVVAGASGRFHLLAHLATVGVVKGQTVEEGQTVGALAEHVGRAASHVHWEVRDVAVDSGKDTRAAHTVDPAAWVRDSDIPLAVKVPESSIADIGIALLMVWLLSEL